MKLDELKEALRAADPAAVLVSRRVLGRVIQATWRLPSAWVNLPHRKGFVLDRRRLFQLIEPEELELDADRLLPASVILLPRPQPEQLARWGTAGTVARYWRLLFHAHVHLTFEEKQAQGDLTAAGLKERIAALGPAAFAEIQAVLRQERYLPRGADDAAVYQEFAAVYLELRYFAPGLRASHFPTLTDLDAVDRLLARDVDADALFAQTRPPGAADVVVRTDDESEEPEEFYWQLVKQARKAAAVGNEVRAAILRTQAARVAPADLTQATRADAQADLQRLTVRLGQALHLPETAGAEWLAVLPALLDKADQGHWTVEARLLYDLQKACVEAEREIFALDVVEWVRSSGKRPIKRPLPAQRSVRRTANLRAAAARLPAARVTDADRRRLGRLLEAAVHTSEERLRARVRPVLVDALDDVGLAPADLPERVARDKLVEELLDRLAEQGFFTFSDLRDALSRNQLKLPDLEEPQQFVRGDPLLRLDRRLATALDGIYRPSEVYLRLLQRATSLAFATPTGRWVTRNLVAPGFFAVAFLETVQVLVEHAVHLFGHVVPAFGPLTLLANRHPPVPPALALTVPAIDGGPVAEVARTVVVARLAQEPIHFQAPWPWLGWSLTAAAVVYLWALLNVPRVRSGSLALGRRLGEALRWAILDWPSRLLGHEWVRRSVRSWPAQLGWFYAVKPLVVLGLVWLVLPAGWREWCFNWPNLWPTVVLFLGVLAAVNSQAGRAAGELLLEGGLVVAAWLRAGLLRGVVRWLTDLFGRLRDALERFLYTVDELLRFRQGEGRIALVLRTLAGAIWFPFAYLLRLNLVVLIEPGINPLKLPASITAGKVIAPMLGTLARTLTDDLTPGLGYWPAVLLAGYLTFWFPDVFGFLFWELKENWRLYRANRRETLRPAVIGHHGETVVELLRPGLHSGTLPKLFAHLRQADRRASLTGEWRAVRALRHELHGVEQALRRFADRELLPFLRACPAWSAAPPQVGAVRLAGSRVVLALEHADAPLTVAYEELEEGLVAVVDCPAWVGALAREQRQPLLLALSGLHALAGAEWVRAAGDTPDPLLPLTWEGWVAAWQDDKA